MSGFVPFRKDSQYPSFARDRSPFTFHETIFMPLFYRVVDAGLTSYLIKISLFCREIVPFVV